MAKIYNSKILDFSSAPLKKPEGQFWYDSSNKVLKRSDGTAFSPIRIDKNIVDDANTTLASKLSLLDGIEKDNVNNTIQYSGAMTTILGGASLEEATTIVQACDSISINNTWGASFGIGEDAYNKISAIGESFTFNGNEIATSVDLANKQNTLSQYSEVPGTVENNYASSVVIQGFSINLTAEDPSGSVITLGDASYSDANQLNLNATYISGTGVANNLYATNSNQKLPSVLAVVNALNEKQNTLNYYSEESNNTATIDPNTLYINNTDSLNITTGVNGDATYNSITSNHIKFELLNYYSNEYDSAKVLLEEGQITLNSREDILFNLSQYGTTVPVKLSMRLEGELIDTPKVELTGIDRLNVAETIKINNEDVLTTSALNGYIKENTNALVSGIHNNSSSPLQIYASDPSSFGEGNNINISGGYYGIITLAGDGDQASDHPRIIVDPALGIKLLNHNIILDNTKDITDEVSTNTKVSISTNELVLNAPKVSGTLIATDVSESHTEKPNMLITAQAVYWALDSQRVNLTNAINDAKLTAGTGINISEDNVISVEYPEFVASITDEYTASTSLNSFLTNNNYGVTSGKIIITPNINNVGPIYFGEGLTSAAKGFPVYPDQIITLSFNNLENFKCYAASAGDKFNYIAYIGEVDNSGTASGNINANEVKLTSPNGIQYSISITDEGIIQVDPA